MKQISLVVLSMVAGVLVLRSAAMAADGQVVISEIMYGQAGTGMANSEYVELYNPSASPVEMSGWRLTRQAANTDAETNLVAELNGTIPAFGYFLIAHPEYTGTTPDVIYSNSSNPLSGTSTVNLYSDDHVTRIDRVGYGATNQAETEAVPAFGAGLAIERKAVSEATTESMSSGGTHELSGNGYDSNNNLTDFVVRSPQPQTSLSPVEQLSLVPTPTPTPTPSPTPIPSASPSPIPSPTPSASPEPTPSPTPIPSATPEVSPMPTPTPSPVPTPSPKPDYWMPQFRIIQCRLVWTDLGSWWGRSPVIRCQWKGV